MCPRSPARQEGPPDAADGSAPKRPPSGPNGGSGRPREDPPAVLATLIPAFSFGPPVSELVRCAWTFAAYRAEERHHLAPRAIDSADDALSRLVSAMGIEGIRLASAHVGRRKGVSPRTGRRYRKSAGASRLARALLIWGLIEAGLTHRAAIKRWLAWEIALRGPASDSAVVRDAWALIAAGSDRDGSVPVVIGAKRDAFRDFEESQRGANEQIWVGLGIAR